VGPAVGGEGALALTGPDLEAVDAGGDGDEDGHAQDPPDDLGADVGGRLAHCDALGGEHPQADRRVEVAAGDVAQGVGAGHHSEAEGEGHAHEPDAQVGVGHEVGRQDCAAAPPEHQPERAEQFRDQLPLQVHRVLPGSLRFDSAYGTAGGIVVTRRE
jgi:hypothetical protein